jgi:hypothetical protein
MLTLKTSNDVMELLEYKLSLMQEWDAHGYENLENDEYISLLGAIDRAVDLKLGRV